MKKSRLLLIFSALSILLIGNIGCNTKSEIDDTTSGDCLIKTITLGTLKRHLHTRTVRGADSVYTVTVNGAYYPLTIDQVNRRVYNVDSLPVGTDVSRIVFATLNASSAVSIHSRVTGRDSLFNRKDSIDFRTPRIFTVHATDGVSSRAYSIDIRVHREWDDSVRWQQTATGVSQLSPLHGIHALAVGRDLYTFGWDGTTPVVLTASTADTRQWTRHTITLATLDPHSVLRHNGRFFGLANHQLATSSDGITWSVVSTTGVSSFSHLVGAGSQHLFALSGTRFVSSSDGGNTWITDVLETSTHLPTEQVTGIVVPSTTGASYERVVSFGLESGKPVLWQRSIDLSGTSTFPWVNYPLDASRKGYAPVLQNYTLARYDGALLLTGEKSNGNFGGLFLSRDDGYTWLQKELKVPAISGTSSVTVAVDADNYIYIICAGTGSVWRGRINRLGWHDESTLFR